jgi:hypothetical protein
MTIIYINRINASVASSDKRRAPSLRQVLLPLEGPQLSEALRRALRERRAEPAASLGPRKGKRDMTYEENMYIYICNIICI